MTVRYPASVVRERKVSATINGQSVKVIDISAEVEQQEIRQMSSVEPDVTWEHVDSSGHFHAYAAEGKTPTLRQVSEEVWCPDCHENHTEYAMQCILCDEAVKPGTVDRGPKTEWIAGPTTWTMRALDVPGRYGDTVSVRFIDEDLGRELFGVMYIGRQWAELGGPLKTELAGGLHERARRSK